MNRFKGFLLAAVAGLLLSACGGKIPPTHYYSLDLKVPPAPRPGNAMDHTVVVMPLRTTGMLQQDRIVYRESPVKVGYYEYHRWADEPRVSVTEALVQRLRDKGTFSQVAMFAGRTTGDYILRGRVTRLEEVDFEGGVKVYAALELELIDGKGGGVVWSGMGQSDGSVSTSDMGEVVGQMSEAMKRGIEQVTNELDGFLRSS